MEKNEVDQLEKKINKVPLELINGKPILNDIDAIYRLSDAFALSSILPNGIKGKKYDILVILMWGSELGLSPVVSLFNIDIINGSPALNVTIMESLAESSGQLELKKIYTTGERFDPSKKELPRICDRYNDNYGFVCEIKRKGKEIYKSTYLVIDAKAAKRWGDEHSAWAKYPEKMLEARAIGYAVKREFSDVTKGMYTTDEMEDIVTTKNVTLKKTTGVDDRDLGIPSDNAKCQTSGSETSQEETSQEETSQGVNMPPEEEVAESLV